MTEDRIEANMKFRVSQPPDLELVASLALKAYSQAFVEAPKHLKPVERTYALNERLRKEFGNSFEVILEYTS